MTSTYNIKSAMSVIKIARQQPPQMSYERGWSKSWENYYRVNDRDRLPELRKTAC